MPEPLSYDAELLFKQANKLLDHVETHRQDHTGHDADLESPWDWWRLGLVDFGQGLVDPLPSVEGVLELGRR